MQDLDLIQVYQNLVDYFNHNELKDLCFRLGVDHEELEGPTKHDLARELIRYCKRHNQLSGLLTHCLRLRPSAHWPQHRTMEENVVRKTIQVIVADDHHLNRRGVCVLLSAYNDIQVVGEASTGIEAVELATKLKPDVVILDLTMPLMDGSQAARIILSGDIPTKIIILTMHTDTVTAQKLLRAGVKGYLLKTSLAEELPLAIRAVSQGQVYLSPAITDSILDTFLNSEENRIVPAELLTPEEQEVLQLIAEGHPNSAVAEILTISVNTVEKHRASLMSKLNAHDLPSLMRSSIKLGLLDK